MATYLRGPSVDTTATGATKDSYCWFNFTVPMDYVSGEDITFNVVGGVVAETVAPSSVFAYYSGAIVTVNGGVVGIGPYSVSGHSYQIGATVNQYNPTNSSFITSVGLDNAVSFTCNDTIRITQILADGVVAGYSGEGVYSYPAPAYKGPIGWAPALFEDGVSSFPAGTPFAPGDTVSVYLDMYCEQTDGGNPDLLVYPVMQSLTVTYGAHSIPIALTDIHGGFNTGGTAVMTTSGSQTYNAWHAVSASVPAPSTRYADPWLIDTAPPSRPFAIKVGLIPARVGTSGL